MIDLIELTKNSINRNEQASSDFDLNPEFSPPRQRVLRAAGVLAPVKITHGIPELILTKRSSALKHHPGQIAFPGGKKDESDRNEIETALREAEEEIGLSRDMVEILGTLPVHETVTGFKVTPVIGLIRNDLSLQSDPREVEEIFHVPLSFVLDKNNFKIESRYWRGQLRSYFAVPYGPYYIWGATARMLWAWTERVK